MLRDDNIEVGRQNVTFLLNNTQKLNPTLITLLNIDDTGMLFIVTCCFRLSGRIVASIFDGDNGHPETDSHNTKFIQGI